MERYLADVRPKSLIVASLSPTALGRVRAHVEAVSETDLVGLFPDVAEPHFETAAFIEVSGRPSCFEPSYLTCHPPTTERVLQDIEVLMKRTDDLWRNAGTGTISFGAEISLDGAWPLSESKAVEGSSTLSAEEMALVKGSFFSLPSGDFVNVNFRRSVEDGTFVVYMTRQTAVVFDDALGDLRAELLANIDRYRTSDGAWLGIDVGARYPMFRNRQIAVVPASGAESPKLYLLRALGSFDLRGEGLIDF